MGRHPSCRTKLLRPAETPGCRRQELMMHVELFKSQSHHRKEVDRGLFPGYLLLCDFIQNLTLKVQYGRNCSQRILRLDVWIGGGIVFPLYDAFFSTQYYISEGSPPKHLSTVLGFQVVRMVILVREAFQLRPLTFIGFQVFWKMMGMNKHTLILIPAHKEQMKEACVSTV